jgi:acyl carrier protein
MSDDEILNALKAYIGREVLEGHDVGLDPSTPLIQLGVLNSMEIIKLMVFLERTFAVKVPSNQVLAENFQDLNAITRLVTRLR